MVYGSEEVRHDYHKAPVLLQVVCQVLETHFASFHFQLLVEEIERRNGLWMALLALDGDDSIEAEAVEHIILQTNNMFARGDDLTTCTLESTEMGLISVRTSDTTDLVRSQ